MGLTITVACIIELPVFHFMGNILSFVGVEQMLHWVLFFFLASLGPRLNRVFEISSAAAVSDTTHPGSLVTSPECSWRAKMPFTTDAIDSRLSNGMLLPTARPSLQG